MAADTEYTITDLIKTIEDIADYSNQKISNLVGQLVKAGTVVRREEKGRAYFKLA
jgi:predicted transcriptional regulator